MDISNTTEKKMGTSFAFSLRKERGQASVEYVLMLVATVAIFAVLSTKLFPQVKKFADFYLGQYTYCLIDTGSLPKEAGGNPTECEQLATQNGYGGKGSASDTASGKSAEQLQAEAAAKAKANAQSAANKAHNARKVRSSSGRGGRSGGGDSGISFNTPKGSDSANAGAGAGKTKQVAKLEKNSRRDTFVGEGGGSYQSRTLVSGFSGQMIEEQEKINRREASVMQISSTSQAELNMKAKKIPYKPPKEKSSDTSVDMDQSMNTSFGNIFRIALILGIIVVVLYLVGSQIDAVMKGS
jgi:hypothetical protein